MLATKQLQVLERTGPSSVTCAFKQRHAVLNLECSRGLAQLDKAGMHPLAAHHQQPSCSFAE
eukprot:1160200-Pelagomonas_calceolata.AAC.7